MVRGVGRCGEEEETAAAAEYRRVCYYTNWAQYRSSFGRFRPDDIPLRLCTHLVYAFASMTANRLTAFEWNDETTPWMRGMYARSSSLIIDRVAGEIMVKVYNQSASETSIFASYYREQTMLLIYTVSYTHLTLPTILRV